ncbi:L,D-transpeptidase family protein [Aerococcaceae bacterium DSM 109653]|uniref:L,D-transpeptidase family protein n=1 Tax=Fundicoccus ignavus TaxID=2664442 RepID=A0A844BFM2_9LACT|nr:L,D-transpeptidase family protein [Fundicoccus ignavus]MRI80760.1 L,D-transpeptidase family protein [Fundicoccus ignavus]
MQKKIVVGMIVLVVLGLVGYLMGSQYYAERYYLNTEFASVDISNLTQAEAANKLKESFSQQSINFNEADRAWEPLNASDLGITIQADEALASLMSEQHKQNWLLGTITDTQIAYAPEELITIDDKQLEEALTANNQANGERYLPTDAKISYSETEGYLIEAGQTGTELDNSVLKEQIIQAVINQEAVEVSQAYLQSSVTADNPSLIQELEQIQALTSMEITLTIAGYEEVITPEMIYSWLILDENGEYYFDQEMIYDYLGTLNDAYATYDDYRNFTSTLQGDVQLLPGTLGWSIDREAETENILNDLAAGESVTREPAIVGIGYNGTLDDIGGSYIEVDMTYQMMYVYIDGVAVISTPIVTGQIGTNTVPGAYAIWNMESPSELTGFNPRTGVDYVQPVSYWLAFDYTGQGIHDANWQPTFGGDAYLTNGSLGCINTPPDIMAQVYEYAYNGMPVLVFQ